MRDIQQTAEFINWLGGLRDAVARARIVAWVQRLTLGNFGDAKALGGGLHELRIDQGPGYRVYFVNRDGSITILLCGGDKRTQSADIAAARALADKLD